MHGAARLETRVLKGVSRSFYLSLRLLPVAMRDGAAVGYLLARTSDTIADTAGVPVAARLQALTAYAEAVGGGEGRLPDLREVAACCAPDERVLLDQAGDVLDWLGRLPEPVAVAVGKVVRIIVSGQRLDLERFGEASALAPVCLACADELDDYCQRVAGCVGAFWTELGYATLGETFSRADPLELGEMGCRYGRALQLVNILRDMPKDLRDGRCYLPACDPSDRSSLMAAHRIWLEKACGLLHDGFAYAGELSGGRLRAASVLPALLARRTLDRLARADWSALEARVKIPRREVYLALAQSFLHVGW